MYNTKMKNKKQEYLLGVGSRIAAKELKGFFEAIVSYAKNQEKLGNKHS